VTDDVEDIRAQVRRWIEDPGIDVVITTGGTGFTGRDVTPEALEPLFEKRMDGFSAVFHRISYDKIGTSTIQSRAVGRGGGRDLHLRAAGLARRLQGRLGRDSGRPARLPHRPCNFVEIMPASTST
jgi:molybdenum cofactor biosynthesis protein B